MMRFLFFILMFSCTAYTGTFGENLGLYYANIDSSEMALIHEDYQGAISYYTRAFQQKNKPFADDIYNLSVCYLKTGNLNKSMETCFELANCGAGSKFFANNNVFDPLKTMPQWPLLLEKAEKVKTELARKNAVINKKLALLYQKDQSFHVLLRKMKANTKDSIKKLVDHQDSILTLALLDILNKNDGILSAFQLGANLDKNEQIDIWPNYFIIILHNYESLFSTGTVLSPFDSFLRRSVFEGNLKPTVYAFIHDFGEQGSYKKYCASQIYWIVDDKLYINQFYADKDVQKTINQLRTTIMLPSLEHYQQKQIYMMKNPNSPFMLHTFTNRIGSFKDRQSEAEFLKGLKPVADNL